MSQVSDYIIANASGASVRSDINLVLDAIKTLNSGGSDPSNTEAFMPYVDTADNNNLKIRNSQNNGFTTIGPVNEANLGLLPKSGGTMTGQLLADDGSTISSPAYSFHNDTDTGMFRNSANTLGFSTAGVERAIVDSNGLTLRNRGDLRLGDDNSSHYIGIQAPATVTTNQTFTAPVDGSSGQVLQTNGSGVLSFITLGGVPVGSVFCIAHSTVPDGYIKCNGDNIAAGSGSVQGVNRSELAALRQLIGNTLPDLRGEFIRGLDDGRGIDTSGRNINEGQDSQFAQHNHSFSATLTGSSRGTSTASLTGTAFQISETFAAAPSPTGVFSKGSNQNGQLTPGNPDTSTTGTLQIDASHSHSLTGSVSGNTGNQGGTGNSSETRPRNVVMLYIIKF